MLSLYVSWSYFQMLGLIREWHRHVGWEVSFIAQFASARDLLFTSCTHACFHADILLLA